MHTLCSVVQPSFMARSELLTKLPADVGHFGLNSKVMIMESSQEAKRGEHSFSTGGGVFAHRSSERGGFFLLSPVPAELGMSAGIMMFCNDECKLLWFFPSNKAYWCNYNCSKQPALGCCSSPVLTRGHSGFTQELLLLVQSTGRCVL